MKASALRAALVAALALPACTALAQTPNPLQPKPSAPATRQAPAAPAPATAAKPAAAPKAAATGDFKARRTQCSQDWKTAKANNTTGGDKWPQFFSKCNTRLKAQGV